MQLPLTARKALLSELLAPLMPRLVIVGDFSADAALFDTIVLGVKLEGTRGRGQAALWPVLVSPPRCGGPAD